QSFLLLLDIKSPASVNRELIGARGNGGFVYSYLLVAFQYHTVFHHSTVRSIPVWAARSMRNPKPRGSSRPASRRAAERGDSSKHADQPYHMLVPQLLSQDVQLPATVEHGQRVNLEFSRGLQPGAGKFRGPAGDGRRLRLRGRQVAGQQRGAIGCSRRLQCLIRPGMMRAPKVGDQSLQLRLLFRRERWRAGLGQRVFQETQLFALLPMLSLR